MTPPKKILVIQIRRIGDVILALPALEALRAAYPEAEIDVLVERPCGQIFEGHPAVSNVLEYDARPEEANLRPCDQVQQKITVHVLRQVERESTDRCDQDAV